MEHTDTFIIRTRLNIILDKLRELNTIKFDENAQDYFNKNFTEMLNLLNSVNNKIEKIPQVDKTITDTLMSINTEIKEKFSVKLSELIDKIETKNNTLYEKLEKLFIQREPISKNILYDTEEEPKNDNEVDILIDTISKQLERMSQKDELSNNDIEKVIDIIQNNGSSDLKEITESMKRIITKLEEQSSQPDKQDDFFNQILKIQLIQSLNSNPSLQYYSGPLLQSLTGIQGYNQPMNYQFGPYHQPNQQSIYNRIVQLKDNINRIKGNYCNASKLQTTLQKVLALKNLPSIF